jgi:hypothetical protein
MKEAKYLLYIDILGFSEMVKNDIMKVKMLFEIIDSLNAHKHNAYKTIVFSDTILIFNITTPLNQNDHEYLVMYSCEFIQDLIFKTIELDIQFRAILTFDEFYYENLKNLEAYYGMALINAYYKEKAISSIGLFIDKRINHYNKIFPTATFDKDLDFVFLLQTIERLHKSGEFKLPLDKVYISTGYDLFGLENEVRTLKNLHLNISKQTDSKIRCKYLEAYHHYKKRYKWLIDLFEDSNFDHTIISPEADWTHLRREF